MTIDVSVIIPAFNKKSHLSLSLYALEKQSFRLSKVEVIVIDDGSTDGTWETLRFYKPRYHFRLIRNDTNIGRAAARNKGIHAARGRVLIFLDAEIIVEQDFIKKHMRYHASEDHVVVSGVFGRFHGLYSIIDPTFSKSQFEHCYSVIRKRPYVRRRFKNAKRLRRYMRKRGRPKRLMNREYIDKLGFRELTFDKSFYKNKLVSYYGPGLQGFHIPWISFLSGNISVTKENVEAAGFFDESFQGYGFEDWELGYRLFRNGSQFIAGADIVSYHQEHPYSHRTRCREHTANHLRFFEKHNDIGIALLALHEMRLKNLFEINQAVDEYAQLCEEFPDSFIAFKEAFYQFCKRLVQDRAYETDLSARHVPDTADDPEARSDKEELKRTGRFPQLVSILELK